MRTTKILALFVLIAVLFAACAPAASDGAPAPAEPTAAGGGAAVDTPVAEATAVTEDTPVTEDTLAAEDTEAAETPAAQVPETGSGQELTSTELNLYAWSEYIPTAALEGFEEEFGVKVNYDAYSSNEELLAKLQAGGSGYDVIIPSDYMIDIMVQLNMLAELDKSQIPNLKNIDPKVMGLEFDPENKYTVPYQWGTVGLAVNTEKVTEPVDSWSVLWDPKYQGKVVLLDDVREVLGMSLRVLGYDLNSTDPAQLEEAKQKTQELMPNVKLFDSDNPKAALLSEEAWLGMTWNGEAALAHQENPAIDYVCPKEGCVVWFDNLAIPADAPHKDAAHAFINYLLRPEVSILITQEFPYSNPNQAALELLKTEDPEMYESYMGFRATNPTDEDLANAKMVKDVGEATILWDEIWTEVKGN